MHTRDVRFFLRLALCGLALLAGFGPASAQLQSGDLFGTVTDENGEDLPGVTVTLSGIGAPRVQITDAQGRYRFLSLPPGQFQLQAALEGFNTVEVPDVTIRVGRNSTINVKLSAAIEETITVTADAALIDARQIGLGNNVSAAELDQIPTARDPWALLSQAPSVVVDRVNVGGNESGQQSGFLGTGSMRSENTFAIDGVILNDMAAIGASSTYYDFGAFEEVQFTTSSTDVEIATAGVTINQVTKRATNDFKVSARYLRTDGDLQSSPSILDNGSPGNEIDVVEEFGADVGGALLKDKLWLWGAYGESDINNLLPGPTGAIRDTTLLEDFNTKLNFQPVPQNSGVLHYWTNDKLKFGRGASINRAPETTHDQTTPADIWKFEDTHIFGSNFFLTVLGANTDQLFTLDPQGGLDADGYWDADGVLHGTFWDFSRATKVDQGRVDLHYFFNAGDTSHEVKWGGSFRDHQAVQSQNAPRGKMVRDCTFHGCDPNLPENTAFVRIIRDRLRSIETTYDTLWIQDTIEAGKFTVTAGLRYDVQKPENQQSVSPANPVLPDVIPELVFPGNDAGGFEWETLVPRLGVSYALGDEGRTLVRGSFSQYTQQLGHAFVSRLNPTGTYIYAGFYFVDANQNLILDDSEIPSLNSPYYYNFDPSDPSAAFLTASITDPDLDPTMTTELSAGIDHILNPNLVVAATVTMRNIDDITEARLLVRDGTGAVRPANRDDWALLGQTVCATGCTLPDGSTVSNVPVYSLDGVSSTGGRFLTTGDREQDYLGLTVTAEKRMANGWRLNGHFTISDWDWDIGPEFQFFDDPTDTTRDNSELNFGDGNDPVAQLSANSGDKADVWSGARWSFNVNALYQVAPNSGWGGLNVGASITGREGYASPVYAPATGPTRRVQLAGFDEFRNDDILTFDVRVEKDFQLGDARFTVGLDGFNILNDDATLQRTRNLVTGNANFVREALSPRVFRLGVKFRFN